MKNRSSNTALTGDPCVLHGGGGQKGDGDGAATTVVDGRGYNFIKWVQGGFLLVCVQGIGQRRTGDVEFGEVLELGLMRMN